MDVGSGMSKFSPPLGVFEMTRLHSKVVINGMENAHDVRVYNWYNIVVIY